MEYEEASAILKKLLDKYPLTPEEKEAVQTAMGLLTLGTISKNHLKSRLNRQKTQKDKDYNW